MFYFVLDKQSAIKRFPQKYTGRTVRCDERKLKYFWFVGTFKLDFLFILSLRDFMFLI